MVPSLVLEGEKPRLIDEWQEVPQLWDAVRYEVDRTNGKGQYILLQARPLRTIKESSTVGQVEYRRYICAPCHYLNPVIPQVLFRWKNYAEMSFLLFLPGMWSL